MAAVIRLKRRLEDEPSDSLILNCKRRRTRSESEGEASELSTVLKFAGTLQSQEDDIFIHLKKRIKSELEEQFKKHNSDINAKLKSQKLEDSKSSRYRIVNSLRYNTSNITQSVKSTNDSELTVYDIETERHEDYLGNTEKDIKYVYDLYYTSSDELGDAYLEDYVNMSVYNDELVYGSLRDNGVNIRDSDDDSEDSNAESNWKNDYPDESDPESITEEDMFQAMEKCDLNDLSSDDEEESFVYNMDDRASFEEETDNSEIERYGERYARFKAKHTKNTIQTTIFKPDFYYGDIDEKED